MSEKDLGGLKTNKHYKQLFRGGLPDKNRRDIIL
jgi:hypothetical protein